MRALRGLRSIPRQSRLCRTSATAAAPAAATVPASPIAPRSDYSQTGFVPSIDAPFDGAFNAEGASMLALPALRWAGGRSPGGTFPFPGAGRRPRGGQGKKFRLFRAKSSFGGANVGGASC